MLFYQDCTKYVLYKYIVYREYLYLHFWARGKTASGWDTKLVNNAGSMCQIIESSNKSLWLETKNSTLPCPIIALVRASDFTPHSTHN